MAVITEIIPKQNFEIVGEIIGDILNVELQNQKTLQAFEEDPAVYHERIVAFDHTDQVAVNVLFDSMPTTTATQSDMQGKTNYLIDVYAHGKAKAGSSGDEVSAKRLLKFVGMIRYILQSHKYITLGMPLGTIGGKSVDNIQMYEQQNTPDASFGRMCRITFSVRIQENQAVWDGILLDQNITQSKLDLTEKGYQYKLKQ